MRVLALCLGNICRSPVAEALLRRELAAQGVEAVVDSAGTGDWHVGRPADPRSTEVARRHGVRLNGRARQLLRRDFADYDLILAMDSQNAAEARALAGSPGAAARVRLMRDFDPLAPGADVPDPYLGGRKASRACTRCWNAAQESLRGRPPDRRAAFTLTESESEREA